MPKKIHPLQMTRALPSSSVSPANMFHSSSDVAPFGKLIRRVGKVTLTAS